MEYQVPQFIDVEDKLIGPLTLRQFIYLAGAGGICIVFFSYMNIVLALLFSAAVIALAACLAFYKINGKSFIQVLDAGFNYYIKGKLFLWKHEDSDSVGKSAASAAVAAAEEAALHASQDARKLTRGKLSDLALSLDVPVGNGPESSEQQK